MASMTQNIWTLWSWPLLAGRWASDWAEMAASSQRVIATRLPMIATAFATPLLADHRELTRMVSEKVDAFGTSQGRAAGAMKQVTRASTANARAAGRVAGGGLIGPVEWMTLVEVNVAAMAAMVLMPTGMLAPLHRGATANDRRLGRR